MVDKSLDLFIHYVSPRILDRTQIDATESVLYMKIV